MGFLVFVFSVGLATGLVSLANPLPLLRLTGIHRFYLVGISFVALLIISQQPDGLAADMSMWVLILLGAGTVLYIVTNQDFIPTNSVGTIEVLAGDFQKSRTKLCGSAHKGLFLTLKGVGNTSLSFLGRERLYIRDLEVVEEMSPEKTKSFLGSAGGALVGGALLGGVGLVAGALAGGNKKKIIFAAKFKDGRKFVGTTNSKTFVELKAAAF